MLRERRVVYSLILISVILAGQTLPMVDAVFATLIGVTYPQDLQADANGNTYLYVPPPDHYFFSYSGLEHDSDMNYDIYRYYSNSWMADDGSLAGMGEEIDVLQVATASSYGWLGEPQFFPSFINFMNSTNTYDLSINDRHMYFGMPIGEVVSLVLDPIPAYFGTFNVTTQEFFHLTVTSREDYTELQVMIADEMGRIMNYMSIPGGEIDVIPFAPDGPGMYVVVVMPMSVGAGLTIVDLLLEDITPDALVPGEIVEGVLPGSELIVKNEGGDTVHQEKAPAAHTYKFSSPNNTYPGRLRWALNHPELDDDIYEPFETRIQVTTDSTYSMYPQKHLDGLSNQGGSYYYQSFQGETYYLTILGMEETTYSLVSEVPEVPVLPLEMPIYLESYLMSQGVFAYRLPLSTDSILKLNTSSTGAFNWMVYRTFEDGVMRSKSIPEGTTFHGTTPVYLPAGDYLLVGTAQSIGSAAVTTFTLGPVVDGVSHVSVNSDDVVGIKVPTEALTFYNFNVTLETHDNVTVDCDIDVFDQYGGLIYGTDSQLGNQQAGLGWIAIGANRTMITLGLPLGYDMFGDGYGIISISPHRVRNNTGTLTDLPAPYMVDYSLTQEDYASMIFNGTESWTSSSPGWVNFTLGEPGDVTEYYMIQTTCEPGTWYNMTHLSEDINTIDDIIIYQKFNGYTQKLDFTDLTETESGTVTNGAVEFGSISNELLIIYRINRATGLEGSLDVLITPYTMNTYDYPPAPQYMGPLSGTGGGVDLGTIAISAGVVGVAVVIVVVIFVARKRGMF